MYNFMYNFFTLMYNKRPPENDGLLIRSDRDSVYRDPCVRT